MILENILFQLRLFRRDVVEHPLASSISSDMINDLVDKLMDIGGAEELLFDSPLLNTWANYHKISLVKLLGDEEIHLRDSNNEVLLIRTQDFIGIMCGIEEATILVHVLDKWLPVQGNLITGENYLPPSTQIDFSLVMRDVVFKFGPLSQNTYDELIDQMAIETGPDPTKKYAQTFPYLRSLRYLRRNFALSPGLRTEELTRVIHPRLVLSDLNIAGDYTSIWKIATRSFYDILSKVKKYEFTKEAIAELKKFSETLIPYFIRDKKKKPRSTSETN